MFLRGIERTFHTSVQRLVQAEKSLLAKLRKKTGYPISNCKKALDAHNNNLEEALKYLHEQAQKEGWAKAEKLQGRKTSQGLIGILVKNKSASMVEINCETDFVSRNKEFLDLVEKVSRICTSYASTLGRNSSGVVKVDLSSSQLLSLAWESPDKRLSDLLALKIGQVGENLSLRRAVCLSVDDQLHLGSRTHPTNEADSAAEGYSFGKYGAISVLAKVKATVSDAESKREGDDVGESDDVGSKSVPLTLTQCGRRISQHIIGMSPQVVGDLNEEPLENRDDEIRMVHQEFLLDSLLTVGDFLKENGVEVADFVRYECGEEITATELDQSAQAVQASDVQ